MTPKGDHRPGRQTLPIPVSQALETSELHTVSSRVGLLDTPHVWSQTICGLWLLTLVFAMADTFEKYFYGLVLCIDFFFQCNKQPFSTCGEKNVHEKAFHISYAVPHCTSGNELQPFAQVSVSPNLHLVSDSQTLEPGLTPRRTIQYWDRNLSLKVRTPDTEPKTKQKALRLSHYLMQFLFVSDVQYWLGS